MATIEFQERGAVHYHCVFFNLPFTEGERLTAIWKNGNANIDYVRHVGKTATYMTKRMSDDERLQGQKSYLNSRGLHEPVKMTSKEKVEEIVANSELTFKTDIDSEYYGKIEYQRRKKKPTGK